MKRRKMNTIETPKNEENEEVVNKEDREDVKGWADNLFIYQIYYFSENEQEYYTYNIPTLTENSLIIKEGRKKESIIEEIVELEQSVETNYLNLINNEIKIDLESGFLIKKVSTKTIPWIFNSEDSARSELINKVNQLYKQYIPKLLGRVKDLESVTKNLHNNNNLLNL